MNAAASLIKRSDGRILLVQEGRRSCRGKWSFPAGVREKGEGVARTAIREVHEETGLFIVHEYCVSLYENIQKDIHGIVFFSRIIDGKEKAGHEIMDLGWFTPLEIKDLQKKGKLRADYILLAVTHYLEGRRIPLEYIVHCE